MCAFMVTTPQVKKKASKAFTARLKVTLRVGIEFEGETFEFTHEADTLSTMLAEHRPRRLQRRNTGMWK